MYEDLEFGELQTATRVVDNDVETLEDTTVERQSDRFGETLHLNNIGEGSLIDVSLDLVDGEITTDNKRRTNPDFDIKEVNVEVSDGEMTITMDRAGETIELVVECEGEVNDNTGPDLEEFGMDI